MSIINASSLQYTIEKSTLVRDVSLEIAENTFTAIIGPNGAGKSTLLKLLVGELSPSSGLISLFGNPLNESEPLVIAKRRAVLPQIASLPFALSVYDIVEMGREPHRYTLSKAEHDAVIAQCLEWTDLTGFTHKTYQSLSGGEQHRVQIARTLTQICVTADSDLHGQILFLDEPTNHLDILHQFQLMQLLQLLKAKGLTIVIVLHDLSLALSYADSLVLLDQGAQIGRFTPTELMNNNQISKVYGLDVDIFTRGGHYFIMPPINS